MTLFSKIKWYDGIFFMQSIIVQYEFWILAFPQCSNLDIYILVTLDGLKVFDQFDFFFLAGIGGGFYIIKCIKVCVKDNWYSFFLYFPMHIIWVFFLNPINFKYHLFKNLFLSPPQKNHITGMQYSFSSINDDTFVLFI